MIAYFRIKNNEITGMSRYPYEEEEGCETIEKEVTKEKFSMGVDIFVYENGKIKEVPPPEYDDDGNKI